MRREQVPQEDDIQYRDYLLSILISIPDRDQGEFSPDLTDDEVRTHVLQFLDKKFKQDFGTEDNTVIGALKVPVEVMKRALIEDFNIDTNSIPPQENFGDGSYLEQLIDLSGVSSTTLRITYHMDLLRLEVEESTRVRENILALQEFMRDGAFNGEMDGPLNYAFHNPFFLYKDEWRNSGSDIFFPENHYAFKTGLFAAPKDRNRAQEMIDRFENQTELAIVSKELIMRLNELMALDGNLLKGHRFFSIGEYSLALDHYNQALKNIDKLNDMMSRELKTKSGSNMNWRFDLNSAEKFHRSMDPNVMKNVLPKDLPLRMANEGEIVDIFDGKIPEQWPFRKYFIDKVAQRYNNRAELTVNSVKALKNLEALNTVACRNLKVTQNNLFVLHDDLVSLIPHILFLMLPVCLGDIATVKGEFVKAAECYAKCAKEYLLRGSFETPTPPEPAKHNSPEADGDLPWSWCNAERQGFRTSRDYPYLNNSCEVLYILLHLGQLYLSWADHLYRTDKEASVYRARELYKALLLGYGFKPVPGTVLKPLSKKLDKIDSPDSFTTGSSVAGAEEKQFQSSRAPGTYVSKDGTKGIIEGVSRDTGPNINVTISEYNNLWEPFIKANLDPRHFLDVKYESNLFFWNIMDLLRESIVVNPAILAQQMRAQIGYLQIDSGLNFFGYPHNIVPLLRYRPLAQAAQYFSSLAWQSERDFIDFMEKAEALELESMKAHHVWSKANIHVQIEAERISKTELLISQAKIQVKQVEDAITAKEKEIEDHSSFWGQVKDFLKGVSDFIKNVPESILKPIGEDFKTAWTGTSIGGIAGAGGFALFGTASGVSISSIVDEGNKRVKALNKLKNEQLPMAQLNLWVRERELAIAQMQQAVARLDVEVAMEIIGYSKLRMFNTDTWYWMATTMKRIMSRYMDLSIMTGWMAERALSYHQARDIRLIQLNYYKSENKNLLASDALQADLAQMEKEYICGFRQATPLKWSISLARDYPLQYGQLLTTGACTFMTNTDLLNLAYPGSYNHRIRAVEVAAVVPFTASVPLGTLSNPGVSRIEGINPDGSYLHVRPPNVLPLSNFVLKDDMVLYDLPGDSLMPFEGSGIETFWILEFPPQGNLDGLEKLADVVIIFDLYAEFSFDRRDSLEGTSSTVASHTGLFSLKQMETGFFESFVNNLNDSITLSISDRDLLSSEVDLQVVNVFVLIAGSDLPEINGKLATSTLSDGVDFTTSEGIAHSTNPGQELGTPAEFPSALNPLIGEPPKQEWTITLTSGDNPNLDRNDIDDIILGIEYQAIPSSS